VDAGQLGLRQQELRLILRSLTILAITSGCSMALVTGPGEPPKRNRDCTTLPIAPIADVVLGAASLVAAGAVVALAGGTGEVQILAAAVFPAVIGAVYLGSSSYGFGRVSRCREFVGTMSEQARQDAITRKRVQARALMDAARGADCDTVRTIAPQVLALDPELHRNLFLADAGIARCLAPAE
jgi:hypothetical protein